MSRHGDRVEPGTACYTSRCAVSLVKRRSWSWAALVVAVLVVAGCAEERDDGTRPEPDTLPALALTDETPDLLLTWVDARGGTHTEIDIASVPAEGRSLVRVVTPGHGHGALFYVADLTSKGPDGRYPVKTMPRHAWEVIIQERRRAYVAEQAPPPAPPPRTEPRPAPPPGPPAAVPSSGVTAIIYGAHWCQPCHQAAAYLRQRGVTVVEHDIEKQPRARAEMQRKLQAIGRAGGSIPVIDVAGQILVGYSRGSLDAAIRKSQGQATRL